VSSEEKQIKLSVHTYSLHRFRTIWNLVQIVNMTIPGKDDRQSKSGARGGKSRYKHTSPYTSLRILLTIMSAIVVTRRKRTLLRIFPPAHLPLLGPIVVRPDRQVLPATSMFTSMPQKFSSLTSTISINPDLVGIGAWTDEAFGGSNTLPDFITHGTM
jgi:hypothetical protein